MNIIPVFIPHLGCPYDCIFCNQNTISSEKGLPDVQNIIETALHFCPENSQVAFYGGSFTAIAKDLQIKFLEIAKSFIDKGKISSIRISTRPDYINDEILEFLKSYGVNTIELGAQSMCDDVLLFANRGHTALDVIKASAIIKKHNVKLGLQAMVGLPLDTRYKAKYTATQIKNIKPDFARIYPAIVVPDTQMHTLYKNGEYTALSLEDAVSISADMLEILGDIPVIRIGINPSDELSNGGAIAGAYHPALGEMVYSEFYLRKILQDLKIIKKGDVYVYTNKKNISKFIGQNKSNIAKIAKIYPKITMHFIEDNDIKALYSLKSF